jgi:hypothetical protein
MKKIKLALFVVITCCVSCGEKYEEEQGLKFEGTWTLIESYAEAVKIPLYKTNFVQIKEIGGNNLLLFYSGGLYSEGIPVGVQYDSSFFYRIQDENNLYVYKVKDSIQIIEYYLPNTEGNCDSSTIYRAIIDSVYSPNPMAKLENSGQIPPYYIIDTIIEIRKPLSLYHLPEELINRHYGKYFINSDTLTINRYRTDREGAPTNILYGKDIYLRFADME